MTSRTVLITGGGIGIGRATALAFAAADHHVVVTDVLEAEGNAVADLIRSRGGSADFRLLDVTDTAQAQAVVADTEARRGAIDVIVANAGIAHRVPLAAMTDEKWDHTFDVDLKGIFRVVRPALPGMIARGSGAIVALSSVMGVAYGWDEHVHYSAAKAELSAWCAASLSSLRVAACVSTASRPVTSAPPSRCRPSTRSARRAPKPPLPSFPWAAWTSPRILPT